MLGEKRAAPGEQNGARLLSGHHEGHEFVAKRRVVHAAAVALLVDGVQQTIEQVERRTRVNIRTNIGVVVSRRLRRARRETFVFLFDVNVDPVLGGVVPNHARRALFRLGVGDVSRFLSPLLLR